MPADIVAIDIITILQNSVRWFLFVTPIVHVIVIIITNENTKIQRFYLTYPM